MPVTVENAFLFTDIEGSTRLWERDAHTMRLALVLHDGILTAVMDTHGGRVFKTIGDAFCVAFADVSDALHAALDAQRMLLAAERDGTGPRLRVRMAIHIGEAEEKDGDFFGPALSRVNRLLDAGHGGQILVSSAAKESLGGAMPEGVEMRDLGERRLKDLPGSERIFQIVAPDLPSDFPPLRTLDPRAGNLPAWPTPFIGREPEVAEVSRRIREEARLLTLTGPGGTGKTRLALRAAESLVDEFEDGVFFVPLASISDHRLIASSIAKAFGLAESGDLSPDERVKGHLRNKETLLVLDNFEHLAGAATLASELLSECPKLKVLATSRSLFHLYGEQEHPVPPLSLPDDGGSRSVGDLFGCESVRLFVERARAVKYGFALTEGNAPDVAEVCRRLDGLPLAIELAAARVRTFSPSGVLDRLDNRMKLLVGGARDLPERHQSLRGAISWSHDLLGKDEKFIFRRLAVFSGGCTPDAAREVCGFEAGTDMYGELRLLEEKSLIRHEETPNGESRFTMLETIREYAIECLEESGEADEARRRHAGYFLEFAETGRNELRGPRQTEWMDAIERDHDNVRAALSWSLEEPGRAALALRTSAAMGWFWEIVGYRDEGWRWLEAALEKAGVGNGEWGTGKIMDSEPGSPSHVSGESPSGWKARIAPTPDSRSERSEAASRLPVVRADALNAAGYTAMNLGRLDQADSLLEEALEIGYRLGEKGVAATSLTWLGLLIMFRGDIARAEERFARSRALFREAEDEWGYAGATTLLGGMMRERGERRRGLALLEESLEIYRRIGDEFGASASLNNLGYTALFSGDYEDAAPFLEESIAINRRIGNKGYEADMLCNLGLARLLVGEPGRSAEHYRAAISLCRETGQKPILAESLEGLAATSAEQGGDLRAASLLGAAGSLSEAFGFSLSPEARSLLAPYLDEARSRLGEAAWERAVAEGSGMTLDEAVEHAMVEERRDRSVG